MQTLIYAKMRHGETFQWVWKSTRYNRRCRPPTIKGTNIVRRIWIIFDFRNVPILSSFRLSLLLSELPRWYSDSFLSFSLQILFFNGLFRRGDPWNGGYEDAWARLPEVCQGKRAERYWKTYEAFVNRVENNGYTRLLFFNDTERSLNSIEGRCPREYPITIFLRFLFFFFLYRNITRKLLFQLFLNEYSIFRKELWEKLFISKFWKIRN